MVQVSASEFRSPRNSPAAEIIALLTERGAEVAYHDPYIPSFRDRAGRALESRPLGLLLAESNVMVVVTPHSNIDWERVYAADLVVDTTNSSRGHVRRSRQVLRLGAGWTEPARQ